MNIHPRADARKSRAFPINSFKDRDDWIKLFLAVGDELSCTAKVVGVRIAFHRNIENGQCNPSLEEIANGTGMSERNVRRMLRELEETGWLCTNRSQGWHTHSFELTDPTNSDTLVRDQVSDPDNIVRVRDGSTRTYLSGIPGQTGSPNPDTVVRQKRESNSEEKSEGESPEPDLGDEVSRQRSPSNIDAEFEEFWLEYPKKADRGAARTAYRRVRTKGIATREELLNGAMAYSAERAGQDPKFTKNAATWLNAESWANEVAMPFAGTMAPPSGYGHHHLEQALADAQLIADGGGQ